MRLLIADLRSALRKATIFMKIQLVSRNFGDPKERAKFLKIEKLDRSRVWLWIQKDVKNEG